MSTYALFIAFMQLVNGTQFLNITYLLVLFTGAASAAMFGTIMVALAGMYASLWSHKSDHKFVIEVLNLMSLLALYVSRDLSFIPTQFLF